jgi:transposase-like protein
LLAIKSGLGTWSRKFDECMLQPFLAISFANALHRCTTDFQDLSNLIEQDHRFIKRLVKLGMGFFSFETAWRTLQEYEAMNMLKKGQIEGVEKSDNRKQMAFIASLFGVAI